MSRERKSGGFSSFYNRRKVVNNMKDSRGIDLIV